MDVSVEVGDWEHASCGAAIERGEVVDLECLRWNDPDGREHLSQTHHDVDGRPRERVRGRVVDIHLVREDGSTRALLRVPSGSALTGWDADDDGYLEDPWTGEVVVSGSRDFLVTVRAAG